MEKIKTSFKKRVALLTILCMIFTFIPMNASAAIDVDSDISGHWAEDTIQGWMDEGTIEGYEDGSFKPENNISRAEFMTLVNGIFNYTEMSTTTFADVKADAWYANAVAKAIEAGYIDGYPDGTMKPENSISREEAATIMTKINKLMVNEDAAKKFIDAGSLSWSKGAVGAVCDANIMNGYPDLSFQAKNNIKRGEAVVSLDNAVLYGKNNITYDTAGTYGPATGTFLVTGNAIILEKGITLQNMVINGDLIIDKNVGEGDVTLKNVTVKGETKIYGGGANSIIVIDSTLGNVTVSKVDGKIRIVISGHTTIGEVTANSGVTLQESNLVGDHSGFQEIILDAEDGDIIIMIGLFTNVEINSPGLEIQMPKGTTIDTLTLNEMTDITGVGIVGNADINVSGVTFETEPTTMDVATGVTEPVIETPAPATGGGGGGGTPAVVQVSGISIAPTTIALTSNGAIGTLTANVTPSNASNIGLTWSSSNDTVATVSGGAVTTGTTGTAIITATTLDGAKTATCEVIVGDKVISEVSELSEAIVNQTEGETWVIEAGIYDLVAVELAKYSAWKNSGASPQAGWYFPIHENNITIIGVGNPTITSSEFSANGGLASQNFITVFGDNVTIEGLKITCKKETNKAIEIYGKDFTLKNVDLIANEISLGDGEATTGTLFSGSIYFSPSENNNVGAALLENVNLSAWISVPSTIILGTVTLKNVENNFRDNFYADYLYKDKQYEYGVISKNAVIISDGFKVLVDDKVFDLQNNILSKMPTNSAVELAAGTYYNATGIEPTTPGVTLVTSSGVKFAIK